MKKAVLVLEGVTDEELRAVMTDPAVIFFLSMLATKYQFSAVYIGAGQSVPSDLYHKMKEPVFSCN